jgi:hypothetical protein
MDEVISVIRRLHYSIHTVGKGQIFAFLCVYHGFFMARPLRIEFPGAGHRVIFTKTHTEVCFWNCLAN